MKDYLRLIRAKHWIKNLFVFLGVIFAGKLFTPLFIDALYVFISLCFATSIMYILNDLHDKESDSKHSKKKNRPLASGKIKTSQAYMVMLLFTILLATSFIFIRPIAMLIILSYMLLNLSYTFFLREIFLIDVFSIAFSFMLRIFAGTYGINLEASPWFLVTVLSLSLFLGFGKRFNEKKVEPEEHRKSMRIYETQYLTHLMIICATLALGFYSLHIINNEGGLLNILTIPIAMYGFFRYFYLTHIEDRGDPLEELLNDKPLLLSVVIWGALILIDLSI